ncbi:ATP-binding cassette sub-family G member 4 [Trachymyrmex zeteki]|uniref:ATP-binding cassette sub-family G member 4 n=1 Tax=Mycetomoellerius zeteki TaxID=64791 RepID=A0A151WW34_9HYME|nr:PREDICTED: ATP-binding cassette sub-family G member 1-like [Trachymyrmex zeteki]KYQ52093.1 ATP-binding cassette sub-family G member 4 [Trachymyrmex zeteki]
MSGHTEMMMRFVERTRDPQQCANDAQVNRSLCLLFENVSYSVQKRILSKERKTLLNDLNGDFRPGELTAIMGLSGAGKSTLMDILAGFTTTSVTGRIMINGQERNMSEFRKLSAYIMQDDNLQSFLTVQEAMFIAADLKLDLNHHQKSQKIDKILVAMGLDESRYMITGVLSGGQRKRLAIALELINNPPVLFLDEPTSGLDSTSSKQCLALLKQLAQEGRTIICTLHQPSAILFNMLDHLYVIANGNCVYTGSTHNLVPYLNSIGFVCPTHYDPVDFLMEICNGDYGPYISKLMESIENGKNNEWRSMKTVYLNKSQETITSQQVAKRSYSYEMEFRHTPHYTDNFWRQLCILIKRNAIRLFRDKALTLTRISMHLTIALIVGTLYFKIGEDAAYVLDNYSLSYYNIMFLLYSAFSATMVTIPLELPILKREHFNRWYKLQSYYLAGKLSDFLIQLISTFIYTIIVYYMSGQLPESRRFGLYMLMCFVTSLVGQTAGFIIGCALKIQNSVIFGPFALMPFIVLSGFFVHIKDVNPYFVWLFDISFCKYAFEGILMVIYGYDRAKLKCSADYCHFATPKKFLMELGIEHINYWFNMTILISLCIVLDIIACIILNMRIKKRI